MSPDDSGVVAALRRLNEAVSSGAILAPVPVLVMAGTGAVMSLVGQVSLLESWYTFTASLIASALGTLVIALPLLALGVAVRRSARPVPTAVMVVLFLIVGGSRMWVVADGRRMLGVAAVFTNAERILVGAAQGLTWLGIASVYYAARDRFAAARAVVLEEQALIEERARRQSALSGALARELATTVDRRVSDSVARSRRLVRDALDLADSVDVLRRVAASLRTTIDDEIRPMSHRLWTEAPAEQMRLTVRMVLRLGCYARPYPLAAIAAVGMLSGIGVALAMPDGPGAIGMLVLLILSTIAVLHLVDRLMRHPGVPDATAFWTGVIASEAVVALVPIAHPLLGWSGDQVQYWMLLFAVGKAIIIVSISVALGLTGTWASVLERARASLSEIEVTQRIEARGLAEASRLLARHLHSSLQGRLMAIVLELERAADDADRSVAEEALHRLEALLDTPIVQAIERPPVDLAPALTALVREWSAIADVHLTIDVPGAITEPQVVVGVVEEALSNAVRHGHATRVDISIAQ